MGKATQVLDLVEAVSWKDAKLQKDREGNATSYYNLDMLDDEVMIVNEDGEWFIATDGDYVSINKGDKLDTSNKKVKALIKKYGINKKVELMSND